MKLMQRGNKQLRVADDQLEAMLRAGYIELDPGTGRPVRPPAETEGNALKKEDAALKKENEELRTQVKELSSRLEALSKTAEG